MTSRFQAHSAREAVLAEIGEDFVTTKEIVRRVGCNPQIAITHLYAAETDGIVERGESKDFDGHHHFLWRRCDG